MRIFKNWLLAMTMLAPLATFAAERPPVLEAEISDEATLPANKPHRFYALTLDNNNKGVTIFDGDTGALEASLPAGYEYNLAFSPDRKSIYVTETYWSHGNRGDRADLFSIYDALTLHLQKEIALPGRALADRKVQDTTVSATGKRAYSYNMHPASSVTWIDIAKQAVGGSVEVPGCSLVFPFGDDGFSSLCGDGALATVTIDDKNAAKVLHGKPFFDPNKDPIFENSLVDARTGEALFISYTGLVYPAKLGAEPAIGKPWSLQAAAGHAPAGTGADELAWRPGGRQLAAWHKKSGRLFVLMHPGGYWSQSNGGTEIWVLDVKTHALIKRLPVAAPGSPSIAVSQDEKPLLFVISGAGNSAVVNPDTGEVLRKIELAAGDGVATPDN
jgi:methylamine dehydrogenase heavy chain